MLTRLLHLLYDFITEDLRPCVSELREYIREKRVALEDTVDLAPAGHDGEKQTTAEEDLVTIKEAEAMIPAGRTRIYLWRKEGKLQTVARGQRDKRLIRREVEAMREWARDKGKR